MAAVKEKQMFSLFCHSFSFRFIMPGNDAIHEISSRGTYRLKVRLTDWDNVTKFANYATFRISSESAGYRLTIDGYSGDAGKCNIKTVFVHFVCSPWTLIETDIV